jgi:hypothetical protein
VSRYTPATWTTAWRVSHDGTTVDEYRVSFTEHHATTMRGTRYPQVNRYSHAEYAQHFGETPQAAIAVFIAFYERQATYHRTQLMEVEAALVHARRLAMRHGTVERAPPA